MRINVICYTSKGKWKLHYLIQMLIPQKPKKNLGILMCDNLSWSVNTENCISKAMAAFTKSNGISRKKNIIKVKIKLILWIHCTNHKLCIANMVSEQSRIKTTRKSTKRATSWVTKNFKMSYTERLKFLKLLPLSMYFELHDILYLVLLLKN